LAASAIIATAAAFWAHDVLEYVARGEDAPPVVDFTWTPVGRVSLREMKGLVRIQDDHAIDFSTYRFRIVEIDRMLDLLLEGLMGREYEQPVSLSLIADDPVLRQRREVTIEVRVADDIGQEASVRKVIKLK